MIIELKCAEPGHEDKRWKLAIESTGAVLCADTGEQLASFSREAAQSCFELPSLAENRRHFALNLPEQTVRFHVDAANLGIIESFLFPPPPRSLAASLDTRPRFSPVGPKSRSSQQARQSAGSKNPYAGAAKPAKIIIGILAILFSLFHVAWLLIGENPEGEGASVAGAWAGHILGLVTGAVVTFFCFRRKSDEASC